MSKILANDLHLPITSGAKLNFIAALHTDPDRKPQFAIKETYGRFWHLERDRSIESTPAMAEHIRELKANGFFDAEVRAFGRVSNSALAHQLSTYLPFHRFAMRMDEPKPIPVPHTITDGFPGELLIPITQWGDSGPDGPYRRPRPTPGEQLVGKYFKPGPLDEQAAHAALQRAAWGPYDTSFDDPDTAEAKRMVDEFFDEITPEDVLRDANSPYQLILDYHKWLKTRTRAERLQRDTQHSMRMANHPAGSKLPGHSSHSPRGQYSYDTSTHHYEVNQNPITGEPLEAKAYNLIGVYGVDEMESRRTMTRLHRSWVALGKQP